MSAIAESAIVCPEQFEYGKASLVQFSCSTCNTFLVVGAQLRSAHCRKWQLGALYSFGMATHLSSSFRVSRAALARHCKVGSFKGETGPCCFLAQLRSACRKCQLGTLYRKGMDKHLLYIPNLSAQCGEGRGRLGAGYSQLNSCLHIAESASWVPWTVWVWSSISCPVFVCPIQHLQHIVKWWGLNSSLNIAEGAVGCPVQFGYGQHLQTVERVFAMAAVLQRILPPHSLTETKHKQQIRMRFQHCVPVMHWIERQTRAHCARVAIVDNRDFKKWKFSFFQRK